MSIALNNRVDLLAERVERMERQIEEIASQVLVISTQLQALSLIPPQPARKPKEAQANGRA